MSKEQQSKNVTEQEQAVSGELSDSQLEKVAAGSRPNRSTPLDTHSAKTSDNFSRH